MREVSSFTEASAGDRFDVQLYGVVESMNLKDEVGE
jgi:hypothetical protein